MIHIKQEVFTEINIILNKTIGIKFIYSSYNNKEYELEINGLLIENNSNYENNLIEGLNNITLKWNAQLTTCINMFRSTNIIQLDIIKFDTSSITNVYNMFYDCRSLISLNLKNFNTTFIESMQSMFKSCYLLISLDLSHFDTSLVTSMQSMFEDCGSLISLNLENFNTSSVNSMNSMFSGCKSLQSLNLNNFITSSVKNMGYMFGYCYSLASLNIDNFNTKSSSQMEYMFCECKLLTSLNLSSFNTSSVTNMSFMFRGCYSLISLNINNFNTISVNKMEYMFYDCYSLESLYLSNFNTAYVKKMDHMFQNCKSLISLNLNHFDTSSVESIENMFYNCYSLKSLNVDNFNTSTLTSMNNMFFNCSSLISLDVSNFDTSSVTNMNSMFQKCSSLISLNLNNFNISSIQTISDMFNGCSSLISLNLSHFDTSSITYTNNMFLNCNQNLVYCINDDKEYKFSSLLSSFTKNCNDICFTVKEPKFIIQRSKCIENCEYDDIYKLEYNNICYEYKSNSTTIYKSNSSNEIISYESNYDTMIVYNTNIINDISNVIISDSMITNINNINVNISYKNNQNSTIITKSNYANDIISFESYSNSISEYNSIFTTENISYEINTNSDSIITLNPDITNDNISIEENPVIIINPNITNSILSYENNSNLIIINNPNITYININTYLGLNLSYFLNYNLYSIYLNYTKNKEDFITYFKDEVLDDSNYNMIYKIIKEYKKDIIIKDIDAIYQFTSSDNQKTNEYYNISNILLGKCETKLKKNNNIDDNETLFIFKIDKFIEGSLIPIVEYEIYNIKKKSLELLNLDICNDSKINIFYPVDIEEDKLFLYNRSSEFYTDICFTYTADNGTDITLNDRKNNYINKNMSICEVDCELDGYNNTNKKVSCECQVKLKLPLFSEIIINKDALIKKMTSFKNIMNLKIMKCYKILFTKEALIHNIGSYTLLLIIVIIIINIFIFSTIGYKLLINQIIQIILRNTQTNNVNKSYYNGKKIKQKSKGSKKSKKTNNKVQSKYKTNIKVFNLKKKYKTKNNPIKKNTNKIKKFKNKIIKKNKKMKLMKKNNNFFGKSSSIIRIKSKKKLLEIKTSKLNKVKYNEYELNALSYNDAIKTDKRSFIQYYWSLLRIKQVLIFTFYTKDDNNSRIIKISLFLFSLSFYYTINALFFNDSVMHEIYENQGNFVFIYQLPQIIYSSFISSVISILIKFLALSQKSILEFKYEVKKRENISELAQILKKYLKIKFVFFFTLEFLFLIFFWYYLASFCAIYKNTQAILLKDTTISFCFSLLYPIVLSLIPGIFRICSLRDENKDKECKYKFSQFIQLLL